MTTRKGLKKQTTYTDEDKQKAAFLYAIYGVMSKVSEELNIPEQTLSSWKGSEWWEDYVSAVRSEAGDELIARFTRCAVNALDGLDDRLKEGNWHFDSKTTGLYRVPVPAKDLVVTAAISTEKSLLLQNRPTSITEHADGRLDKLLAKFTEAGNAIMGRLNEKVIEGEVVTD